MIVIGTPEEITAALRALRPDLPPLRLEMIRSGECYFILEGVLIKIILMDNDD